jgi:hypothetical protein
LGQFHPKFLLMMTRYVCYYDQKKKHKPFYKNNLFRRVFRSLTGKRIRTRYGRLNESKVV